MTYVDIFGGYLNRNGTHRTDIFDNRLAVFDVFAEVGEHRLQLTTVRKLATEKENVQQRLLDAAKLTILAPENRRVFDVPKFVGLDGIRYYRRADFGLLAVHTEIEPFQNFLQNVRYFLQHFHIVAENPVIVAIADYFVFFFDFLFLEIFLYLIV